MLGRNTVKGVSGGNARHSYRAHVTETAETVIVLRPAVELNDFERATQVHVQTGLLRLAVEGRGTVNDGVRGMNEAVVIIARESKQWGREITTKNPNAGLKELVEPGKFEVQ